MALPMVEEVLQLGNDTINDTRTSNFSGLYSFNFIVFLYITYTVIFVLGLFGNISTCIVIWRNRCITGTNFYIIVLSISGLLILIFSIPLQLYTLVHCRSCLVGKIDIIASFLSEAFSNASVLTITAFTYERYFIIRHPFTHQNHKSSRVVTTIIVIWIIVLVLAMPRLMQLIDSYEKKLVVVSETFSLIIFLGSMIALIVLSVLIFRMMKTSPSRHPVDRSSSDNMFRFKRDAYRRRAIKILVTVTLTFCLCWVPLRLQRLISIYEKNLEQPDDTLQKVYIVLTPLSSVMYYIFTGINPFLYSIMSKDFRDAFKDMLPSWCRRRDRHRLEMTDIELLEGRPLTTSQLCEPRTQCLNLSNLTVENEESNSGHCKQQLVEGSNSLSLRQSI